MKKQWLAWSLAGLLGWYGAGCGTLPTDTDQELKSEVLHRLNQDDLVRREVIGVTVSQGTVTLFGNVSDDTLRMRAVGIAGGTPGVQKVDDRLQRK